MSALIELPWPAKILWPNGRTRSFMARHREFQKHKNWAKLAALAAIPRHDRCLVLLEQRLQWSATFYPKTRHSIDDDNARASLKAYQDGIALALGVDDKFFNAPAIHFAEPVKNGKVVIVVEGA